MKNSQPFKDQASIYGRLAKKGIALSSKKLFNWKSKYIFNIHAMKASLLNSVRNYFNLIGNLQRFKPFKIKKTLIFPTLALGKSLLFTNIVYLPFQSILHPFKQKG